MAQGGASLAGLFGYDPLLVARLPPRRQRVLRRLSAAWLLACLLLALPLGYASYALEHSLALATLVASAALLIFANMVRLTVAGGGLGAYSPDAALARYRPGMAPVGMLALLSVLLAQPAQLPYWRTALDGPVAAQRAALVAQHAGSHVELDAAASAAYAQKLERCDFLVLRLRRLWDDPQRALPLSLLYILLVLVPALWSRFLALDTLRDYERVRLRQRRAAARDNQTAAQARVEAQLSRYASYRPRSRARGQRWLEGRAR